MKRSNDCGIVKLKPVQPKMGDWNCDIAYHMSLLSVSNHNEQARNVHLEEMRTAPLFSAAVADAIADAVNPEARIFPQYGLLAKTLDFYNASDPVDDSEKPKRIAESAGSRLFLNVNTPWSAFICGSQGTGKSHTLSCMLEAALMPSKIGRLPKPLAGIIFHYDKFSSTSSNQICEAAYLCSSGIPVRVLVSPSNFWRMKQIYSNMPGLPSDAKKPVVKPLLLKEKQLDVERMMKLMAVNGSDKAMPLYMEVG